MFSFSNPQKNRLGTREGALIANEAYSAHPKKDLEGNRTLIDESEFAKAYRTSDGRIQIGVRGTSSIGDVMTDIGHLTGKDIRQTDRYKSTEKFIKDVSFKNQKPVELFSHSLGGLIANKFTQDNPRLVSGGETYNTFATGKGDLSTKLKHFKTKNDPVSALGGSAVESKTSSFTDYVQNPLSAHSLDNFLKNGGVVSGQMKFNEVFKGDTP
jgi:hypothetical protein